MLIGGQSDLGADGMLAPIGVEKFLQQGNPVRPSRAGEEQVVAQLRRGGSERKQMKGLGTRQRQMPPLFAVGLYASRIVGEDEIEQAGIADVDLQFVWILRHPQHRASTDRGNARTNGGIKFFAIEGKEQIAALADRLVHRIVDSGLDDALDRPGCLQGTLDGEADIVVGVAALRIQQQDTIAAACRRHHVAHITGRDGNWRAG